MNLELILQQCKIYENKSKDITVIPYADALNFYRSLDISVLNGRRIQITFPLEKLDENSHLIERFLSCQNGKEFLHALTEPINNLGDLIENSNRDNLRDKLKEYLDFFPDNSLYNAYNANCIYDKEYQQYFIYLEPVGDGLPSVSFTVD